MTYVWASKRINKNLWEKRAAKPLWRIDLGHQIGWNMNEYDYLFHVLSPLSPPVEPNFCSGCGAPRGSGPFCSHCGQRLQTAWLRWVRPAQRAMYSARGRPTLFESTCCAGCILSIPFLFNWKDCHCFVSCSAQQLLQHVVKTSWPNALHWRGVESV